MSILPDPVEAPDMREREEQPDYDRRPILPAGCAVTPLGFDGKNYYLLDEAEQFLEFKTRDFDKGNLIGIFGGARQVAAIWPKMKFNKSKEDWEEVKHYNPKTDRWEVWDFDQARAQADMIEACRQKGVFNPVGRIFGRGAHRRKRDGALIFHLGNKVITVTKHDAKGKPGIFIEESPPGWVGNEIYPALKALPTPAVEPSSDEEAMQAQAMIGEWAFEHPEAAKLVILGWIGLAFICGAVEWRPHIWLTGETAAGKSTLQKWLRTILDDFGLFSEDASEPAVRQILNDDTLPVMIDEAEADDNPERQKAMVNLARKASSGAKIHRGGADHKARDFTAQSTFLFSSIMHSIRKSEDRNRMAILQMNAVPSDKDELVIDWRHWGQIGRRMNMRMIHQWPRFERTLADYKVEIQKNGFQGRWRATFGTLLACADMLLHHCAPSRESEGNESHGREVKWVQAILPLMMQSRVEAQSTTERCIEKLTSSVLAPAPGSHAETVGKWIVRAITPDEVGAMNTVANEKLRNHGMRIVNVYENMETGKLGYKELHDPRAAFLAVAYGTNEGMSQIFKGSQWFGGGWVQALAGEPRSRKGVKVKFGGKADNAICVPVDVLVGIAGQED